MSRLSSRANAGFNNRYSAKEYVLASFMKGKKHAVLPMTAININPINVDKGEIKLCGETTPLTIVGKGSKAQMQVDKTKFAKETGSEEIDLGSFIDDEEDEKENVDDDIDFIPKLPIPRSNTSRTHDDPLILASKTSHQTSVSSNPTISYDYDKNVESNNHPSSSRSKKRSFDSESSVEMSVDDQDDEDEDVIQKEKPSNVNDDGAMLARLFSKKKPSSKKKKNKSKDDDNNKRDKCTDCENLNAELKKLSRRLERIERVVPVIKHFYRTKQTVSDSVTAASSATTNVEEINRSIKDIFGVEASQVRGPRERPTIIIRHLFTISNHAHDYRHFLDQHRELLKAFVQSRCPGILDMEQTWQEIVKSMASLANDIRKNNRTKLARQKANLSSQQQTQSSNNRCNENE